MLSRVLISVVLAAGLSAAAAPIIDWPARVQKPYENLPLKDLGLRPLLVDAAGKPITTPAAWETRKAVLAAAWQERLGKPPAKADQLDVRVESEERQPDHLRRLLSFATEGDDRLKAYLLLPNDLKPNEQRPAVVVFHQTTKDTLKEPVGLGSKPDLALALQLVKRGFIALSPECCIMKDGGARVQAEAVPKRRPGWTGLGKMTFDGSRCVDFLEKVPSVDRERIGCIGHSLGAKEVLYAMAFEPRYKAGVFCEGGIGLRMSNWTDPWYLTERMKPHIPAMENHQVMALIAPRPFLVIAGDSADGDASWTFVSTVRPVYELLGARDQIGLHNHHQGHAFPAEARELAYQWLETWLGPANAKVP
jgi:hypothetical protein